MEERERERERASAVERVGMEYGVFLL